MKVLGAFVRHEVRLQRRSPRFLAFAFGFLALACLPALAVYVRWPASPLYLGPATFAAETLSLLPVLAAALGFALGAEALQRERDEGSWPVLALTPLSNGGYLFRRWFAVQGLLLPLVAIPLVVAAAAARLRCGEIATAHFAYPLLVQVVPITLFSSALGLGLGTVARGVVGGSLLAGLYLSGLDAVLERVPGAPLLSLGAVGELFNVSRARWTVLGLWGSLRGEGTGSTRYPVPASEAPLDPWVFGEQLLARGLVVGGACFLALGVGLLYMGRTQRDLRPWRVPPDHPLRNLLAFLNRLRLRYSWDGGLRLADRTLLGLGVLGLAASLAVQGSRTTRYGELAETRRAAAVRGPAMPAGVAASRYRIRGSIAEDGRVRTRGTLVVENRGNEPVRELVFALNPDLRVEEVTTGLGTVRMSRRWDRLRLELEPSLGAGDRRRLAFAIAGRPARQVFEVGGWIGADRGTLGAEDFARAFGPPGSASRRRGLGDSYRVPAISSARIALSARDLAPVPRYAPVGEEAPLEELDPAGDAWAPDPVRPPAEMEIDLQVPPDVLAADACGGLVRRDREARRLRSRCALPPSEYLLVGGEYDTTVAGEGGPVIATLPHHGELARLHFETLARTAGEAVEPWPGLPDLASRIVVEWPDPAVHRPESYLSQIWDPLEEGDPRTATTRGRLLLIAERRLVDAEPLEVAPFLARTVAEELLARRPVRPDQEEVVRRLYEGLARLRLGFAPRTGAVVPSFEGGPGPVLVPLAEVEPARRIYWELRFPALVAALQNRAGPAAVVEGIDRFTAEPGVGSLAELFVHVAEAAGEIDLGEFVEDFVERGVLPEVTLAEVRLEPRGGRWLTEGEVVNRGGGQAFCRVEALTSVSSVGTWVAATPERPGRFALETRYRPLSVVLDPEQLCHRYRPLVPVPIERVDFAGVSS